MLRPHRRISLLDARPIKSSYRSTWRVTLWNKSRSQLRHSLTDVPARALQKLTVSNTLSACTLQIFF